MWDDTDGASPEYAEAYEGLDPSDFEGYGPQPDPRAELEAMVNERLGPIVETFRPAIEEAQSEQALQFVDGVMNELNVPADDGVRTQVMLNAHSFSQAGFPPDQALSLGWQMVQGNSGQANPASSQGSTGQGQPAPDHGFDSASGPPRSLEQSAARIAAKFGIRE